MQKGEGEGEGEKLTLSPKPPSLFPFLPIPYPFRCLLRRLRVTCRIGVHTILAVQYSVDLQHSSQIVETGAFVLNFLQISYIHASHLCSHSNVPLSFPNVDLGLQSFQCSKIRSEQHWGRRGAHLSENKGMKRECKKFEENSRETASVTSIVH